MSQAGRFAHQQNKNRHAQRTAGVGHTQQADTIETATWLTEDMSFCRELSSRYDNTWTPTQFVAHRDISASVSTEEAERRLRYMSKLGFLQMSVLRKDGKFVAYTFSMVNPNLPQ